MSSIKIIPFFLIAVGSASATTAQVSPRSVPHNHSKISNCANPKKRIEAGRVSSWPADAASLDIKLIAPGLTVTLAKDAVWPKNCVMRLSSLGDGRGLIGTNGFAVFAGDNHVEAGRRLDYQAPLAPVMPNDAGGDILESVSLASGSWRAGVRNDGKNDVLVAAYLPGQIVASRPILNSTKPILGLMYLSAPDSLGGLLSFWQQVGKGHYRFVTLRWSEQGLRGPSAN